MPTCSSLLSRGRWLPGLILLLVTVVPVWGQSPPRANYAQATRFSAAHLTPLSYSTTLVPGWIGKTDTFWYSYRTSKGTIWWKVDPARVSKTRLFDHEKLAAQLAELSRKPVDPALLPLTRGQVNTEGTTFTFVTDDMLYEYNLGKETLTSKGKAPAAPRLPGPGRGGRGRLAEDEEEEDLPWQDTGTDRTTRTQPLRAPDGKMALYTKDYNLYLVETGKEKEPRQITRDGTEDYAFRLPGGFGPPRGRTMPGVRSIWSSDSRFFYAQRDDRRNVKELFVINSLATPRPTLEKYKYGMPAEEFVRKSELHIASRDSGVLLQVKPKWRDETYTQIHWDKKPGELRFVRLDRLQRNLELCALDAGTGHCRVLFTEGFENAQLEHQAPTYLDESNEMIWWSERSGWGHFYLYDREGKLKNPITRGAWRASRVVQVDEKNRTLYFLANAREKDENVYYSHLYSVKLDGTGLTLLDSGDAIHTSDLSPSKQYLVDNCSRVDRAPQSVLRNARGEKIMDLEQADLSRLMEYGWRLPETFVVKAADGVTDLYGNLWKPFDFDPKKKYPIIAHVYPGPQTEGVTHTFSAANGNMQLAQLGFIVVQVGHRGGTPTRSKAYGSYGYGNLRDYGLEDKKAALEQLAARHPWIDISKVGIYGHSGGGFMSAAAVLQKPYNEFFKAAVASAGNHDNMIYENTWAERYHGMKEIPSKEGTRTPGEEAAPAAPPVKGSAAAAPPSSRFEIKVPSNAELAANLKGRLLLVHGEIDNNVHPANTMRLVDALIKANKRFDLLILPGKRHGFGDYQPYFTRRMWEFFAEHLLGDRRSGADLLDGRE
jgi:dipeptidyl aminopeptidase/acylaminoacyl peptidase